MSSNFGFLQPEWPQIYESAAKAESFAIFDPGMPCDKHCTMNVELLGLRIGR